MNSELEKMMEEVVVAKLTVKDLSQNAHSVG